MSIELEVKLGDKSISQKNFKALLSETLTEKFGCDLKLVLEPDEIGEAILGGKSNFINLKLGNDVEVACHLYSAGSEDLLGNEGGWWINVSLVTRDDKSFLLMIIIAVCLAKLIGCNIVDDALRLGDHREIDPNYIMLKFENEKNKTFDELSEYAANKFNWKPKLK